MVDYSNFKVLDNSAFGQLKRKLSNTIQDDETEEKVLEIIRVFLEEKKNQSEENFREIIDHYQKDIDKLRNELQEEKEMGELVYSSLCAYCQRRIGKMLSD